MVLLAISGNLRPVFAVQNVSSAGESRKREVKKAVNNTVYRVGNQRFTDYLRDCGLPVDIMAQGANTVTYVSNPLLLEQKSDDDARSFSFVRTLHALDLEEGSGTAIGKIPEGMTLSVCVLQRSDIERGATLAMGDILSRIAADEGDDYRYSTVLSVSCIGRHLIMLPENDAEVKALQASLPGTLTMAGFYSYGEIGPMGTGSSRIFAHNESLVLCAI